MCPTPILFHGEDGGGLLYFFTLTGAETVFPRLTTALLVFLNTRQMPPGAQEIPLHAAWPCISHPFIALSLSGCSRVQLRVKESPRQRSGGVAEKELISASISIQPTSNCGHADNGQKSQPEM